MARQKVEKNSKITKYSKHQIVWAKIEKYPWWPARIVSLPSKANPHYKVDFIGDRSYSHLLEQKLANYEQNRTKFDIQDKSNKQLCNAVIKAAELYQSLLEKQGTSTLKNASVDSHISEQKQQLNQIKPEPQQILQELIPYNQDFYLDKLVKKYLIQPQNSPRKNSSSQCKKQQKHAAKIQNSARLVFSDDIEMDIEQQIIELDDKELQKFQNQKGVLMDSILEKYKKKLDDNQQNHQKMIEVEKQILVCHHKDIQNLELDKQVFIKALLKKYRLDYEIKIQENFKMESEQEQHQKQKHIEPIIQTRPTSIQQSIPDLNFFIEAEKIVPQMQQIQRQSIPVGQQIESKKQQKEIISVFQQNILKIGKQDFITNILKQYQLDKIPTLSEVKELSIKQNNSLQLDQQENKKYKRGRKRINKPGRKKNIDKFLYSCSTPKTKLAKKIYRFVNAKLQSVQESQKIAMSLTEQILAQSQNFSIVECFIKAIQWVQKSNRQTITNYYKDWTMTFRQLYRQKLSTMTNEGFAEEQIIYESSK